MALRYSNPLIFIASLELKKARKIYQSSTSGMALSVTSHKFPRPHGWQKETSEGSRKEQGFAA
jgi:hypothetical protein